MSTSIKRILICDDVADDSFLLKTILSAEDCFIDIVDSGEEVITFLESTTQTPDLLILDVTMPKMDGIEVVQRLRNSTRFQGIPILLVTGVNPDDIKNSSEININGFIQKPIDLDAVIVQVKTILQPNL